MRQDSLTKIYIPAPDVDINVVKHNFAQLVLNNGVPNNIISVNFGKKMIVKTKNKSPKLEIDVK